MSWSKKHPSKNSIDPRMATVRNAERKNELNPTPYSELSLLGKALANISGAFYRFLDEVETIVKGKENPINTIYHNAVAIQAPACYIESYIEGNYPDDKALQARAAELTKGIRQAMNVINDAYDNRHIGNRTVLTLKAHKAFSEELVTPLRKFCSERGMTDLLDIIEKGASEVNKVLNKNAHDTPSLN